jgi:hypothetical protein
MEREKADFLLEIQNQMYKDIKNKLGYSQDFIEKSEQEKQNRAFNRKKRTYTF